MTSTSARAASAGGRFRADIQGLRGIAVAGVVLFHAHARLIGGGFAGVDVFFVISGFLITGHLLRDATGGGARWLLPFYARRARRILPAVFTVLAATVAAAVVWLPPLRLPGMLADAIATALYVPNVAFANAGTNYLAEPAPSLFQHYWSLGIEEQFYLVWPAVMIALIWLCRRRRGLMVAGVAVLVAASFTAGVVLTSVSQPLAFFLLPSRAWELGAGALVAFAVEVGLLLPARWAAPAGWAGLAGIGAALFLFDTGTVFPGVAAALPVTSAALLILAGATPTAAGPARLLGVRPLQWLGLVSYSLYLVHWPALVLPQAVAGFGNPLPTALLLAIAVACLPAAWLLHRFVEEPGRKVAWLQRRPISSLALAAAVSAVLVLGCTSLTGVSAHRTLAVDRTERASAVVAAPVGTDFVPKNLNPGLRGASNDLPKLYKNGCHADFGVTRAKPCMFGTGGPVIALFGDSHAAQWFPAVSLWAKQAGYRVETLTKSSCPSVDVAVPLSGAPYTACTTWRRQAIARLVADRPAVVLLANDGVESLAGGSAQTAAWTRGLERTITALQQHSRVAVLADTPHLRETPSACLSEHLTSAKACGLQPASALTGATRPDELAAAASTGARSLDFNRYLCSRALCPPIIGNMLVYRDQHHITAHFSAALAPVVGRAVEGLLSAKVSAAGSRP